MRPDNETAGPLLPWWRVGTVWLVIVGPALVVVAGLATLALAVQGRDRPLLETSAPQSDTHTPAAQARNHVVAPRR